MYKEEKKELLLLMERCGHFLYHRRGDKRGQGRILKILIEEGEMTQRDLQERLAIQSGSLSEIVLKLEGAKWVTREKDDQDKRKIKLKITEAGKAFFEEKHQARIAKDQTLFEMLSDEEQEMLKVLMKKVLAGWEENDSEAFIGHRCREDRIFREKGAKK